MESREQRILRPLLDFFSKENNFQIFLEIVVHKTKNMPLRLLDWFVTNYIKKIDVSYDIRRPNNRIEHFSAYRSYRAQLKGCKKKEFDPFCRGTTITLEYQSPIDQSIVTFETASCQLNFFKWAIENLVLNYIEDHYETIYTDMKVNASKSLKTDPVLETPLRRKKNELSQSIFQQFHVSSQKVIINLKHPDPLVQHGSLGPLGPLDPLGPLGPLGQLIPPISC